MSLTYFNAKAANGPKVAAWLEARVGEIVQTDQNDARPKRIKQWKEGHQASLSAVDRMLLSFGFHPCMLPDDVWEVPVERGAQRGRKRILPSEVEEEIRASDEPGPVLAGRFGVSRKVIYRIKREGMAA